MWEGGITSSRGTATFSAHRILWVFSQSGPNRLSRVVCLQPTRLPKSLLEPIPPDGALDPTDTAQPICSKPAHRNKHRVLSPPSRVRRDRDSPTTLIAESRLRRSAAKMKVDAKPHAAGESAVAEVSQAFFDPARLIFDNLVICGYRRSRLGKCSLSKETPDAVPEPPPASEI